MDFQWFFPPDCMHNLMERVSHSVIMLVFQEVLKTINLHDLNSILSNHAFDVSMPTITRSSLRNMKLKLKADDILKVLAFLPLALGNFFNKEDSVWKLLLIHIELLDCCF